MDKNRKEHHRSWSNQGVKIEGKDKNISEMKNQLPLSVQGRKDSSGILIKITEERKEATKKKIT